MTTFFDLFYFSRKGNSQAIYQINLFVSVSLPSLPCCVFNCPGSSVDYQTLEVIFHVNRQGWVVEEEEAEEDDEREEKDGDLGSAEEGIGGGRDDIDSDLDLYDFDI